MFYRILHTSSLFLYSNLIVFNFPFYILLQEPKYSTEVAVKHTMKTSNWEKQLHQIHDETNVDKLIQRAEENVKTYLSSYVAGI